MKTFITSQEALEQIEKVIEALGWLGDQIGPGNVETLTARLNIVKDYIRNKK